jgi:ureidoglycolate lyase
MREAITQPAEPAPTITVSANALRTARRVAPSRGAVRRDERGRARVHRRASCAVILAAMRELRPLALDPVLYAPFGAVVSARDAASARSANHGTALAWDALATIESLRGAEARCTASLFRCAPLEASRLVVGRLERHPRSTQMFAPMRASRFLVVVALGARDETGREVPDLATLAAFVVEGPQAITYAPGVWHHPMVALDLEADFVNVIFADGTAEDCEEVGFDDPPCAVLVPPPPPR